MFPPVHFEVLEGRLRDVAAEVRLAPIRDENAELAAEQIQAYLRRIAESRDGFIRTLEMVSADTRRVVEADHYLDDVVRGGLHRVTKLLREWAPKFASLRAPETDPFVGTFPAWFRPYNDANTKLVRTLLDSAAAIDARLAEEAQDDADAAVWADQNPPLDVDEETVSWDEYTRSIGH
jgi:hypothetical protein